jgi:hypothetical protein
VARFEEGWREGKVAAARLRKKGGESFGITAAALRPATATATLFTAARGIVRVSRK